MAERARDMRFAIVNRFGNPVVRALLRSPLHRLLSDRLLLITVTGRQTGDTYTLPTGYERHGDLVHITVGWPERKRWWRNFTGEGGPVRVLIAGEERTGHAEVRGDEAIGVSVEITLDEPSGTVQPRAGASRRR